MLATHVMHVPALFPTLRGAAIALAGYFQAPIKILQLSQIAGVFLLLQLLWPN